MSEHEIIGRQLVQIESLEEQNNLMIGVIHSLKNGEISLDRIELHENGFSVEPEEVPEEAVV